MTISIPFGATHYIQEKGGVITWLRYCWNDKHPDFYLEGEWFEWQLKKVLLPESSLGPIHKRGDDYRTHTIPVKQSTPRIFNGEVVPPGATHYVYKYGHLSFVTYVEGVPYWNSVESYDRTNQTLTMPQVGSTLHRDIKPLPMPQVGSTLHRDIKPLPEQENIMKKDFSKADLRTGMKVVLRNRMKYIVLLDVDGVDLLTNRDFGLMGFYNYHENLKCESGLEWDIVEVYRAHNNSLALDTQTLGKLIWKREEKSPEQLAYEQLQAQIADEETRHNESMKALREQAEKLKPKQ